MALSSAGYQTTSPQPGTASAPGSYIPVTGAYATYGGATQYTNGTLFLTYYSTGTIWFINAVINNGSAPLYNGGTGGTTTNMPLTGWGVNGGTAPAPTFTTISGSAPAAAPRLQPRVVVF